MQYGLPTLFSSSADFDVLRAVLDLIQNPVIVKDRHSRFVLANQAACTLLGRTYEDIVGRTDHDLWVAAQADVYIANDRLVLKTGKPVDKEVLLTDASGDTRTLVTRKSLLRRSSSGESFVVAEITDVTEFRHAEAQVHHIAEHDGLTGLANSVLFRQTLNEVLGRVSIEGQKTAVLLIDFDRLRNINHALGRNAGDNLIVQFARLVSAEMRPGDLVARIGGDEFAIIQSTSEQPATASALAAAVLRRLETPILFDGRRVHASITVGIAVAGSGEDAEALLRRAELALRQAKRDGGNKWRLFEAEEVRQVTGPFLEDDLRVALQQKQFSIVYQPIASVSDMKTLGYEALLRWMHPVLGPIEPSVFIPLAESEGSIVSIGEWVLREACREAARGPKDLTVSVNVSPIQFTRADLLGLVRSVIRSTGIDPRRIELEITETSVIGDIEKARQIITILQEIGVRVVLDDFGAGYSSLQVLKSLPFDKIKIDRSLLQDVGRTPEADAILSAILRLTRSLGLSAVAEGIETAEQLAALRREQCEAFQGFLLSPPVPNPFGNANRESGR